jgi:hypothetical protein
MSMHPIFTRVSASGLTLLVVLLSGRCHGNDAASTAPQSTRQEARVTAAHLFTERYSKSRLSAWHVHASAAGADCAILLIDVPIVLEDSMIEAMHYGAGAYDVYDGGVHRFYRERTFRGVAYKDASGRVWTYGAVSPDEARSLAPCRTSAEF